MEDKPPGINPDLAAFESAVLVRLDDLQQGEQHLIAGERQMTMRREWLDTIMVVLGFVVTAVLIWAKLADWAPLTGPLPIAGVAIRRIMKL